MPNQASKSNATSSQNIPNQPLTPPKDSQPSDPAPHPQSTPLVKKTAKDFPCTSGHVYRHVRMSAMAEEAEDHILGPMPLETFLDTFLPKRRERNFVSKARRNAFKRRIAKMASCKLEKDMYPIFISAVEDLCPNFPLYDTHAKEFRVFHNIIIKPDVCLYPKHWAEIGRTGISAVEMMAEFKIDLNDDAFIDDDGRESSSDQYSKPDGKRQREEEEDTDSPIDDSMCLEVDYARDEISREDDEEDEEEYEEEDGEDQDEDDEEEDEELIGDSNPFQADITKLTLQGRDTLGQITSYATAQKSAQFRTHFFSMLVFKQHARLLYWDNAGVVVTERFHLTSDHFAEFLGRYNKANEKDRGYDATARLLTAKELGVVRSTKLFSHDARLVKLSTGSPSDPDNFYVAEQLTYMGAGTSPFGRSTRGFIAYSYSELVKKKGQAKKVFLKDTWRVIGRPEEHTFYAKLHKEDVPYIPSVLKALDIQGQTTMVRKLCEEKPEWAQNAPGGLRGFQHYRLILKEVGLPLTEFSSTKQLATILYQALQAHDLAHTKAGILHRDISMGNVMMCGEGTRTALLVDWDMAKHKDDKSPSAKERTGTWQFAAARLLEDPSKSLAHTLQDDLESFVHVLSWVAFRYTKNAFSPAALYFNMHTIFDQNYKDENQRVGGKHKIDYLTTSRVLDEAQIKNKTLHLLLKDLKGAVAIRYLPKQESNHSYYGFEGPTAHYDLRMKFIKSSDGMIGLFHSILENEPWPDNDAAEENPMAKPSENKFMKASSELVKHIAVEPEHKQKRSRMSDISEGSESSR